MRPTVRLSRLRGQAGPWARTFFDAMKPFGTGRTNVNFPGLGDDAGFGRAAFGDAWGRLVEVKRKYDPTNRFRLNRNIQP